MSTINKVHLIGRLTRDPELRYTKNNTPVANYTIAINNGYGEKEKTDYINISTWGKSGEFVSKYFKKGQAIAITGRLNNNNYEDKDGNKRYTTEVITEDIEFVGNKKQDEQIPNNFTPNYGSTFTLDDEELPF